MTTEGGEPPRSMGIPVTHYLRAGEVTQRAQRLGEIPPLPPEVEAAPGSGKLILVLMINEAGTVDRIEIESSYLPEELKTAVVDQFADLRFSPAQLHGVVVKSRMKIEVLIRPPIAEFR